MAANVLESIDAHFQMQEAKLLPPPPGSGVIHGSSPTVAKTHDNDLEELDRFIDDEMERSKSSNGMTWRKLAKCFKWQALMTHMEGAGLHPEDKLYKKAEMLLKSNDLPATSVEYDKEKQEIVRINHPEMSALYCPPGVGS